MRQADKDKAKDRDDRFSLLFAAALAAGKMAGERCTPTPVTFKGMDGTLYPCSEGLCGFAWVSIKPANSSFALWIKRNEEQLSGQDIGIHKGYPTGLDLWCRLYEQSHDRKRVWARVVAAFLTEHGIRATAGDRLD